MAYQGYQNRDNEIKEILSIFPDQNYNSIRNLYTRFNTKSKIISYLKSKTTLKSIKSTKIQYSNPNSQSNSSPPILKAKSQTFPKNLFTEEPKRKLRYDMNTTIPNDSGYHELKLCLKLRESQNVDNQIEPNSKIISESKSKKTEVIINDNVEIPNDNKPIQCEKPNQDHQTTLYLPVVLKNMKASIKQFGYFNGPINISKKSLKIEQTFEFTKNEKIEEIDVSTNTESEQIEHQDQTEEQAQIEDEQTSQPVTYSNGYLYFYNKDQYEFYLKQYQTGQVQYVAPTYYSAYVTGYPAYPNYSAVPVVPVQMTPSNNVK